MSELPENPGPPAEPAAGDVPAALEPDAPTAAQPTPDAPTAAQPTPDAPTAAQSVPEPAPAWAPPAQPESAWTPPPPADGGPGAVVADRPEVAVGAAFAGGLVLALVLKRLAR